MVFGGSGFRQDVVVTLVTQLAILMLSTVSSAVVARWLGPEGRGLVSVALLIPSTLGVVLNGGIGIANVYHTGRRRFGVTTLARNSVLFAVLGSVAGFGIVGVIIGSGLLERAVAPGIPLHLV